MQFTEFDVKVLFVSVLSLLLLSATASITPVAGGFGDPPTFETNAEINLNVPSQPGANVFSEGTLTTGPGVQDYQQEDIIIESDDLNINLVATGYNPAQNETDVNVVLEYNNRTNITNPQTTLDNEILNLSDSHQLVTEDVGVIVEYTENNNQSATIQWELDYHPNLSGGSSGGGGLWSAVYSIAEWLGYFADLFVFALEALFGSLVFVTTIIVDGVTYMFGIFGWITTGFTTIVSSSPGWAQPFVAMPVLLLGAELLKMLILAIDVLWI